MARAFARLDLSLNFCLQKYLLYSMLTYYYYYFYTLVVILPVVCRRNNCSPKPLAIIVEFFILTVDRRINCIGLFIPWYVIREYGHKNYDLHFNFHIFSSLIHTFSSLTVHSCTNIYSVSMHKKKYINIKVAIHLQSYYLDRLTTTNSVETYFMDPMGI
jgi:hypothetical protein